MRALYVCLFIVSGMFFCLEARAQGVPLCQCPNGDTTIQFVLCIGGGTVPVEVTLCHNGQDPNLRNPPYAELCDNSLRSDYRTAIKSICPTNTSIPIATLVAKLKCELSPCGGNALGMVVPFGPTLFNCWEFIQPRCWQLVNGCWVQCPSDPTCCVTRQRYWVLNGQCQVLPGSYITCPGDAMCAQGCDHTSCAPEDEDDCCP